MKLLKPVDITIGDDVYHLTTAQTWALFCGARHISRNTGTDMFLNEKDGGAEIFSLLRHELNGIFDLELEGD